MSDSIKIIFDAQTALKAEEDVKKLHSAIGELSSANPIVSALTSDFSKLGAVFELNHPKLARFGQGLVNVTTSAVGFTAAAVALGFKLAEMSAAFDTSQRAAALLGNAYATVEAATNGTMSASTALRAQQSLVQSGLQTTAAQLGVVARAARDHAIATGVEATQATEQLTDALMNGEANGLRRFGITIRDTGDRVRNYEQALNQLTVQQQGHATAALTAAESLDRFKAGLTHIAGEAATFVGGAGLQLLDWFSRAAAWTAGGIDLQGGLPALIREISNAPGVAAHNASSAAESRAGVARMDARRNRSTALGRVFRDGRLPDSALDHLGMNRLSAGELESVARRADPVGGFAGDSDLNAAIDAVLGERTTRANATRQANANAAIVAADREKRDGGPLKQDARSSGGSNGTQNAIRTYGRTVAEAMLLGATVNPVGAPPRGASAAAFWTARATWQTDVNQIARTQRTASDAAGGAGLDFESQRDAQRANDAIAMQGASDRGEATRAATFGRQSGMRAFGQVQSDKAETERRDSFGGMVASGLGVTADYMGTQAKLTQGYADTVVGAFGKIGNAITNHIGLVMAGKETVGQALLAGANEVAISLAQEALPRSLMELAAGFAALASPSPLVMATAPLHFTAAAIYGSVAAGAGLVAAATGAAMGGGGAAASGDTSRASSLSPKSAGGGGSKAGDVTVVVSSLVPAGVSDVSRLREAGRQQRRVFQPDNNIVPRRLEY